MKNDTSGLALRSPALGFTGTHQLTQEGNRRLPEDPDGVVPRAPVLHTLPDDFLVRTFWHLPPSGIAAIEATSKQFSDIAISFKPYLALRRRIDGLNEGLERLAIAGAGRHAVDEFDSDESGTDEFDSDESEIDEAGNWGSGSFAESPGKAEALSELAHAPRLVRITQLLEELPAWQGSLPETFSRTLPIACSTTPCSG